MKKKQTTIILDEVFPGYPDLSHFERLANTFTVAEISDPVVMQASPGEELEGLWEKWMEHDMAGTDWYLPD